MTDTTDDTDQIARLLSDFCAAALRKGEDDVTTEEDHRLFARMGQIVRALRGLPEAGMEAFRMLLRHESSHVQLWVASALLADGDEDAKTVLEHLAARRGLIGLNASMVLDEFGAGRYRSPFSVPDA
ncbi:MAG: hypothetical protein AAFU65_09125 [Pseudomonadota bacterium]